MDSQALNASYPWYRLRSTQYDRVYVSPHMDDAVYSCGGQIALERAAGKRILVITVFGDGLAEPSPGSAGKGIFLDTAQRKREERAAIDRLDVDHLWLNYPDLLARPTRVGALMRYGLPFVALPPDSLQEQLYAALAALCERLVAEGGALFFPLAIGAHPDHRIVHTVGRAFASQGGPRCAFYEDIPYAQVPALRDDRLRQLGLVRGGRWLASAREVHRFVFARSPGWQRALALPLVASHTLFARGVEHLVYALAQQRATVREQDLFECAIDDVIELKVEAMRDYASQTAFFFPAGDAIYDVLARGEGHYVERYWTLSRLRASPLTRGIHADAERARADTLVRELGEAQLA